MTYDQWKTTDPRDYEREQDDDPPSELDLAYARIIELEKALKLVRDWHDGDLDDGNWNKVISKVREVLGASAVALHNGGKAQP